MEDRQKGGQSARFPVATGLVRICSTTLAAVLTAVLTFLAAVGALAHPRTSLLAGAVIAALAAASLTALHRWCAGDVPGLTHPALGAALAACAPAVLIGATVSGALGGAGVLVATIVLTARCGRWLTLDCDPPAATAARPGSAADQALQRLYGSLPLDVLLEEWEATQRRLRAPEGGAALSDVRTRELLVDELQRRDPAGTARWLARGCDAPPGSFVRQAEDLPG